MGAGEVSGWGGERWDTPLLVLPRGWEGREGWGPVLAGGEVGVPYPDLRGSEEG